MDMAILRMGVKMKIEEVQRTGIDIRTSDDYNNNLNYEFAVQFNSAPCLSKLNQGDVLGIGIMTGTAGRENRKQKKSNFQMGGGRPGFGMEGPGGMKNGGPDAMGSGPPGSGYGDGNRFKVWLKIKLAKAIRG